MAGALESRDVAAFAGTVDLASALLGGEALLASDEFFAGRDRLLRPERAVFDEAAYTDRGKLMDGWEPRRRRTPGHDWCIVRLGVPGRIVGVDVDTDHFLGNHPPFASVFATFAPGASPEQLRDEADWTEVVPQFALRRGSRNLAAARGSETFTHVRLDIHPAGGVARLRIYGEPVHEEGDGLVDLVSLARGGRAVACSDMFFTPLENLLMPGRPTNMGGGWETRRSRPPGEDWAILALAVSGLIERIEVDTLHFRGNHPNSCAVDALYWPDAPPHALTRTDAWVEIVPPSKLTAHAIHPIDVASPGPFTHIRLRIQPDGGVARLRVLGRPTQDTPADPLLELLNGLSHDRAVAALLRCCGSPRWAERVAAGRPYGSRTHLFGHSDHVWWHLGDGDWRAAFDHHPRIGGDVAALRKKFGATASLSENEQAGVQAASESTLQALAQGNVEYEARYGFIFIVCASGKTADEMLDLLRSRMNHEPAAELRIAAGEQAKITRLRLEGLQETP
jgi:allantoicase